MKIWFISDTHGFHDFLNPPEADIVIHCGDFSNSKQLNANYRETMEFIGWYKSLDIPFKIVSVGNHDTFSEAQPTLFKDLCSKDNILAGIYTDGKLSIEDKLYQLFFLPYTREFCNWSYNVTEAELSDKINKIPVDTDILISHGPPFGIRDQTWDINNRNKKINVGSPSLLQFTIDNKIKICAFGHIHSEKDIENFGITNLDSTMFINCACWNHYNNRLNNGILVEIN